MFALVTGLEHLLSQNRDRDSPVVLCTDSMASLATLQEGLAAQTAPLGVAAWRALSSLSEDGHRQIIAQWVPSHCDLAGNERADQVAKEAAELPQEQVPVDVTTICRAVARTAREQTIEHWPPGWFQKLMGGRMPPPVTGLDRQSAIDVHQLRAGHWSQSRSYLHRIGRHPTRDCEGCNDDGCPAMLCPICREEPDRPDHIALRCPALMRIRYRETGTINPTEEEVRGTAVVAALAAAARRFQSLEATSD